MQSCCYPILSASAAAPRLHRSASTAAPRLRLLQLLLTDYIHFSCCSPTCASASGSAAAPSLRPLQLLPDCVCFSCCSLIASASTAAPRLYPLRLLLPDCIHSCSGRFQPMPRLDVLKHSSRSSRFSKLRSHVN